MDEEPLPEAILLIIQALAKARAAADFADYVSRGGRPTRRGPSKRYLTHLAAGRNAGAPPTRATGQKMKDSDFASELTAARDEIERLRDLLRSLYVAVLGRLPDTLPDEDVILVLDTVLAASEGEPFEPLPLPWPKVAP